MADKQDKADWQKERDLDDEGYQINPEPAIRPHGSNETPKHLIIKSLIVRALMQEGRSWDTEVKGPNGRVDVLDYGPPEGNPVVYEVETGCTQATRREKARKYAVGPVRDVLFIDPEDAPDDIAALTEYVEQRVVG